MKRIALLLLLSMSSIASAQTRPLGMPRFADPPESNGADPVFYENGILYNTTLACTQRSNGSTWKCITTADDVANAVATANATQDAQIAATYLSQAAANASIATMNGRIDSVQASAGKERACTTFQVAPGFTVPLTGVSTVINIPLTGVPVGTACDAGSASRMALGARPDPIVQTLGAVNMAFVSNGGILSSVIAIPSGTYRVCCDL